MTNIPSRSIGTVMMAVLACATAPVPTTGQGIDDASRLAGLTSLAVRATAEWDEQITMSAGGATEAQFIEALQGGLESALSAAEHGPVIDPEATSFLSCHVDTFYEAGLIVYSVRVAHHEQNAAGLDVITWLRSWVGSYTAQQLHVIWTLADQCAETFLDAWTNTNG